MPRVPKQRSTTRNRQLSLSCNFFPSRVKVVHAAAKRLNNFFARSVPPPQPLLVYTYKLLVLIFAASITYAECTSRIITFFLTLVATCAPGSAHSFVFLRVAYIGFKGLKNKTHLRQREVNVLLFISRYKVAARIIVIMKRRQQKKFHFC